MNLDSITRFEVINHTETGDMWLKDGTGRAFVKYLEPDEQITYQVQDDGRTLKMFIAKK